MTDELKNIFFTPKLSSIFQKHNWYILSNPEKKYHFNYKGEIADYYLVVRHRNNSIKFNYTLDLEVPKYKINKLLMLIKYVNQKIKDGFFNYDHEANKVHFTIIKKTITDLDNIIVEDVIEESLNIANYLFRNFTLATHNLVYAENIDQSHIELMFMEIEGYA